MTKEPGRPSVYTQEVAETICKRLASGESLRAICEDDGFPARSTVHMWVVRNEEGFADQYTRARQAQALEWAEEILSISDVTDDTESNARSRLRVDTRKWLLSKVLPKVYGDKVTLAGDVNEPIEFVITETILRRGDEGTS